MSAASTEVLAGQQPLPADFPTPVLTCDLIIERELKDAFTQWEYWNHHSKEHWKFERGDKSEPGPKPQPFNPDRCGEMAGYKRHQRAGLPTCAACRAAATAKENARKARARA